MVRVRNHAANGAKITLGLHPWRENQHSHDKDRSGEVWHWKAPLLRTINLSTSANCPVPSLLGTNLTRLQDQVKFKGCSLQREYTSLAPKLRDTFLLVARALDEAMKKLESKSIHVRIRSSNCDSSEGLTAYETAQVLVANYPNYAAMESIGSHPGREQS